MTGYQAGSAVVRDIAALKRERELNDIATAQPETTTALNETGTPDPSQYTYDSDTGQYVPSLRAVESGQAEGMPNVRPTFESKTNTRFLGKSYEGELTPSQQDAARLDAQSTVLAKTDPQAALRLRASARVMEEEDRKRRDDFDLRKALAGGELSVHGALPARNAALRSSIGTGADITGASASLLHTPSPEQGQSQPVSDPQPGAGAKGGDQVSDYLNRVAPRVMDTYIKQGRLAEAKYFSEFVDSEEGRGYAARWLSGVRRHQVGDSAGALAEFERIYNSQLFDDGHTVKLSPIGDGDRFLIERFTPDGKLQGRREGKTEDLANQAAGALSPLAYVKYRLESDKQRDREGAVLDRQAEIERIRQEGHDAREDRRDARLEQRLAAQDRALEKRLAAQADRGGRRGGLTAAQERSNAEIDAAREQVAGLTPDEIRRRTQKQTDTGRENPDYDPTLARASTLASRRKVGADDDFDNRDRRTPAAPALDRKEVASRFRADKTMNAYTLGNETPQGIEVMHKGKVIGHYR